jgi:hypothetical protein
MIGLVITSITLLMLEVIDINQFNLNKFEL